MATFGKLASSSREALKSALQGRIDVLQGMQSAIQGANDEVPDENAVAAVGGATAKGKKGKQSLIRGEVRFVDRLLARLEELPGPDSKLDGFARSSGNSSRKRPTSRCSFSPNTARRRKC